MIISDTKNIANKVKELKRDCRPSYGPSYGLRFTIVGEETFNEFAKHFGNVKEPYVHYSMPKAMAMAEKSKATEAKMVTAYRMEVYKGADGTCSADGTKFMVVAYKGEYYQIVPNGNRFSIFPLEDNREYYQKGVDRNEGHPNLIGALTDKKMSEWAEHIRKYQAEYDAKVEKNAAETNAVISAFKDEAAAADCVSDFGKNYGAIERNGVRIKYQVREDGRVSVEMCLTKFPRTTEEKLAYFAALTR